jgi:phage-related minor tail protein
MAVNDTTPLDTWTITVDADVSGVENKLKTAATSGKQFSSALITAFEGIAIKGKSLEDVVSNLALSLSKLALKSAFKPLEDGLSSIVSGLLSGGGGGSAAFAKGGAFQGGVPTPFASGGVISSPIAFPLGGGQTGIAGEAGAEAIMPLSRGPDGRLGVASSGGGQAMNITFHVQATDADSFARSESQIAALLARAVSQGQRNL